MNTGCVTLWGLDKKCEHIPFRKGNKVVITVTGYKRLIREDQFLFDVVRDLYQDIYFWPQGDNDLQYINKNLDIAHVKILERDMHSFEKCLSDEEMDYIGTRLHGGIYAMNFCRRSIIIAVDNRAKEIGRDTGAPIIESSEIFIKLKPLIESEWKTQISINNDEIKSWKESIKKMLS